MLIIIIIIFRKSYYVYIYSNGECSKILSLFINQLIRILMMTATTTTTMMMMMILRQDNVYDSNKLIIIQ
jgi:hypothetical protein